MQLTPVDQYTSKEVALCSTQSSAINRYLHLVSSPTEHPLQKVKLKRHRAWLECAMAEITKKHSTKDICHFWSQQTDHIIAEVWDLLKKNNNLALFALGKLGANELNLSSDIDLIIVSDTQADEHDINFYRQFNKKISEQDELGFLYRLDYDLRPGGRLGPIISNIHQFEDYYWNQAVTWERVALNRLRPICGNQDVIDSVLHLKSKFCYRKYIDYVVVNDIKNIRTHMHDFNSHQKETNIKLHPGGIRDIELYVNCLQIIHAGKIKSLQTQNTDEAINRLIENKLTNKEESLFLLKKYWQFRRLENLVQIKDDLQTHIINKHPESPDLEFAKVNGIVSALIGEKPKTPPLIPNSIDKQFNWLEKKGFSIDATKELWPQILKLTLLAKNNQMDEILRSRFLYKYIENVSLYGLDRDLGLKLLFQFLKSVRAKKSFYYLLEQNESLIKELAIVFSTSPYLGHQICNRPEILDSFMYKAGHTFASDTESLLQELMDLKLTSQITASGQLLSKNPVQLVLSSCSDTADQITTHLLNNLKLKFPNNSINILKLGKWGGADMGVQSDLDFIFTTASEIQTDDIKISRRFINFITNRHNGGEIYPIDLRLRSRSGTGPIITTEKQLLNYIEKEAQPWEVQPYVRCNPLYTSNIREQILETIKTKFFTVAEINELKKIKEMVIHENFLDKDNSQNCFDLKYSPGGLVDIEFSLQHFLLAQQEQPNYGRTDEILLQFHFGHLAKNYLYLRQLEQLSSILTQTPQSRIDTNSNNFQRLAQHLGTSADSLLTNIQSLFLNNIELIKTQLYCKRD